MFDRCCENNNYKNYEIHHSPTPLSVSDDMEIIIKNLLWYIPNIDSFQSPKEDLIENSLYDEFAFNFIMNKMGMDPDKDILWLDPKAEIDETDWDFFQNQICINCQKAIMVQMKTLSRTNDFLRCIRNSIAHGHFSVVEDYIIGFNKHSNKNKPDQRKAVIKIKPKLLLKALKELAKENECGKTNLIAFALEKVGYTVSKDFLEGRYRYDLIAEKNTKKYVIEIKAYSEKRFLHLTDMETFFNTLDTFPKDYTRVLIIDSSRVTKEIRQKEADFPNFKIIDLGQIKQLLSSEQTDIFEMG